ncbi:glycerophosphodiester phosphodiesterase [Streptacidiphilus fuscans]|uniref:glycerophosphodiester phosphodiesterase n=1 Tax=Streptacidiphilus fuscans TaxID=2789292 RepID=UPI002E27CC99|nr:glycerophosphodiester phosphodiesterase [Streptacidiphilus fuscans]
MTRSLTSRLVRHPYLDHPGPLAFAHRGGSLGGPENSLAAFERAVRLGYRYLETDVHVTSDNVLIAFHDTQLDRVTDGTGAVAQLPWRTVSAARIAGREPIPTLAELLDAFPTTRFNIDVKAPGAIRPLVDVIRRTNAWDRVCVGSFSDARMRALRQVAGPRLATSAGPRGVMALKLRSLTGGHAPIARAVRRQAVCVQVPETVPGTELRLVDRAFVTTAHRMGLQVHVWTVDEPSRIRDLLDLGVDGIMADHIDVLRDVLIERGAWF